MHIFLMTVGFAWGETLRQYLAFFDHKVKYVQATLYFLADQIQKDSSAHLMLVFISDWHTKSKNID